MLTLASTAFVGGYLYSFAVISILLAHEFGHYFMCKKHRVPASLPFFIPMPLSPFGTFGALIVMRGRIPNRKALFDIGITGPLAGLALTIPFLVVGLYLSEVRMIPKGEGVIHFGESLLMSLFTYLIKGNIPAGHDVFLHPLAYAGWVGLFVTALNMLPFGQLDGGHIIYALLGKRSEYLWFVMMPVLILLTALFYHHYLLLLILIFMFGLKHPPPIDNHTPIGKNRILLGIFAVIIFFLSFTLEPIKF